MGYAIMMGFCAACHRPVSFNPMAVPSIRINGIKEPLCIHCARRWNELHPAEAQPIRNDAYEPVDENELP